MKIALTKGTLRVPPTYFALAHAELMRGQHEFVFFTLVSELSGGVTSIPVNDSVPLPGIGFRRREIIMPTFIPLMISRIRASRPDVIHQHFGTWSVPAVEAARRSAIPLLTTLHGADVFSFARQPVTSMARWHNLNVRKANEQSKKLLAVSKFLADEAIGSGMDSSKLEVHYQGIDTDYFTPSNPGDDTGRHGEADDAPVILFVGGLSERKGVRDLIEASRQAQDANPHRLVIAGSGELKDVVSGMTEGNRAVELVGPQDKASIRTLMREASALVVPSKSYKGWREAAGLVALEAAACGTPVIATDCGGLGEMVLDGLTGILVPEDHPAALADAIAQILRLTTDERIRMSAASRRFAVEERSLRTSCSELTGHYESLL